MFKIRHHCASLGKLNKVCGLFCNHFIENWLTCSTIFTKYYFRIKYFQKELKKMLKTILHILLSTHKQNTQSHTTDMLNSLSLGQTGQLERHLDNNRGMVCIIAFTSSYCWHKVCAPRCFSMTQDPPHRKSQRATINNGTDRQTHKQLMLITV